MPLLISIWGHAGAFSPNLIYHLKSLLRQPSPRTLNSRSPPSPKPHNVYCVGPWLTHTMFDWMPFHFALASSVSIYWSSPLAQQNAWPWGHHDTVRDRLLHVIAWVLVFKISKQKQAWNRETQADYWYSESHFKKRNVCIWKGTRPVQITASQSENLTRCSKDLAQVLDIANLLCYFKSCIYRLWSRLGMCVALLGHHIKGSHPLWKVRTPRAPTWATCTASFLSPAFSYIHLTPPGTCS